MEELIFDRTLEDVKYALLNQDSGTFLKGAYNYTDLNRVGRVVQYISDNLNSQNYHNTVNVKTNWELGDIPTYEQMQIYLQNIHNIRNAYYVKRDTPNLPTEINKLNIDKANSIEKNLFDINELYEKMFSVFRYCDTFNCGDGLEELN